MKTGIIVKFSAGNNGWDNNDRVGIASQVVAGNISVVDAAKRIGCVPNTIRNWVKTLDSNNPKL